MEYKEESWKESYIEPYVLGDGPWMQEPDKVQWVDEITGLPCLIVRSSMGALCGYVGVSKGHPYFGKHYDGCNVNVHGGLTYSDFCDEGGKICHMVEEGEDDRVWWLGFDCAHFRDLVPAMVQLSARLGDGRTDLHDRDVYRDMEYVKNECRILAVQLKEAHENYTD